MTSLDRLLEHRRVLEQALGRDPGLHVAAADLAAELPPGAQALGRAVARELARSRRTGRPFVVLLLEAEGLAAAAATCGPLFSDAALERLGQVVHAAVRECDSVVSLAGAALAVVLPETPAAGAQALASRLAVEMERAFASGFLGRPTDPSLRASWRVLSHGEGA